MNFDGYSVVDFPPANGPGFVYLLCWVVGTEETPFYVGQTQSIWGRLNDYYWAQFQAATDFRVGEAIKWLDTQNLRVIARYKESSDRQNDERAIIHNLHLEGRRLLNECDSYNYLAAEETEERHKVQEFMDGLVWPRSPDR